MRIDDIQTADSTATFTELLRRNGYCIIPEVVPRELIRAIDGDLTSSFKQTPFSNGGFYGERTKRFGRLLECSKRTAELVCHPLILSIAAEILGPWCDTLQLNLTQGIAVHPGARPQFPHRDQEMWRGAIGDIEYLVNVMWPFTRYTSKNGTTLIWSESHGRHALDPEPLEDGIPIELEPGSAMLFLGSTLHGAGGNRSNTVRRGAIVSYCLGWLKPYENQWLAYPPQTARTFDPKLAALVGYVQHRPNLGNYEGRCPSLLLNEQANSATGAIDELRPDQQALLEDFIAGQKWPLQAPDS